MNTESRSPESSEIRSGYDRWSSVYDDDANPLPALEEPIVHERLGSVRGLTVLDLGCGTGRHTLWLANAGAIVTAVDFSEGMLAQAHCRLGAGAIRFVVHDILNRLPFEDGFFDRVVSGLVLEHIEDYHMNTFETMQMPPERTMVAPDGADERLLLELEGGGAALFELASGEISIPVAHHTVEEIWYIIGGRGERI